MLCRLCTGLPPPLGDAVDTLQRFSLDRVDWGLRLGLYHGFIEE
jgi:hypothetical protein